MQFRFVILLSGLLATASASPYGQPFSHSPYDPDEIIQKYVSILQQKPYNGKQPRETMEEIIAPNYLDYSASVPSLLNEELNGQPLEKDRDDWFNGFVKLTKSGRSPYSEVETTTVLCGENNTIFWSWKLTAVGNKKYPVQGMQLFYLDDHGLLYKSTFEFNSLAWGADTGQINAYCGEGQGTQQPGVEEE